MLVQLMRPATRLSGSLRIICSPCTRISFLCSDLNATVPANMVHSSTKSAIKFDRDINIPESDFAMRGKPPVDEQRFGDLVYRGTIANRLAATKIISLSSSVMGVLIQPILFEKMSHLPVFLQGIVGSFFGFFVFFTPLLLHQLVKRYVIRLYFNPVSDSFTAVTMHWIPMVRKFYHFTAKDAEVPAVPGMFTSLTVQQGTKKVPLFVNPPDFTSDFAYIKLMKYDEPMDVIQGADRYRNEGQHLPPPPPPQRKSFKL